MAAQVASPQRVSVVIPCYNEALYLPRVLAALARQTHAPLEILIVDGGSRDGTVDLVRQWAEAHPAVPVRVLHNPQRHIPHALNLGIAAARGEIIIRLDGHSLPAPDYVECCLKALAESGAAMVGGAWEIQPGAPGLIAEAIALAVSSRLGAGDALYRLPGAQAQEVDTVPFGCFRRELWQALQGYNEGLLTNEDYEFATRVRQAGGRLWFDPRIRCRYFARATLGGLARQYWRYGWWKAQMLRHHPGSLRWRQAMPLAWTAIGVGSVIGGVFWPPLRWPALGMWSLYAIALLTSSIRSAGQRGWRLWLPIALAYAIIHLAWGLGAWANWWGVRLLRPRSA